MKIKGYHDGKIDISSGLWASFWLLVLTLGEPDLLTVLIDWIGRQP
jgi:hypothetical protein